MLTPVVLILSIEGEDEFDEANEEEQVEDYDQNALPEDGRRAVTKKVGVFLSQYTHHWIGFCCHQPSPFILWKTRDSEILLAI